MSDLGDQTVQLSYFKQENAGSQKGEGTCQRLAAKNK